MDNPAAAVAPGGELRVKLLIVDRSAQADGRSLGDPNVSNPALQASSWDAPIRVGRRRTQDLTISTRALAEHKEVSAHFSRPGFRDRTRRSRMISEIKPLKTDNRCGSV